MKASGKSAATTRCRVWTAASGYRTRCRNFARFNDGRCGTHAAERRKWALISTESDTGQLEREFISRDYLIARIEDCLKRIDPYGFGDRDALVAELYRRIPFGEPPSREAKAVWNVAKVSVVVDEVE